MAKSLESFETGAAIDDIVKALNRDGGIIMLNLAPPKLMDEFQFLALKLGLLLSKPRCLLCGSKPLGAFGYPATPLS